MWLPDTWERVIENSARVGVNFAEQLHNTGVIDAHERKEAALRAAKEYVRHAGYDPDPLDLDILLDTVIEATIREFKDLDLISPEFVLEVEDSE